MSRKLKEHSAKKLCCVAAGRFDNEFALHRYVNS